MRVYSTTARHGGVGQLALTLEVGGRDARQGQHPGKRREVAVVGSTRVKIGRHQHLAVHGDAEVSLQKMRDARAAKPAVALADQILAGGQALILDQPVEDDARQILDVRLGVIEALLSFVLRNLRIAEAGAHRIDEYEIREVEPGARIVEWRCRIRWAVAVGAELHALGTDGAEVQVHGRGARAAVQSKGHRPVGSRHGVGSEHYAGDGLALLVEHRERADRGVVLEFATIERHRLAHGLVGGKGRQVDFIIFVGLSALSPLLPASPSFVAGSGSLAKVVGAISRPHASIIAGKKFFSMFIP